MLISLGGDAARATWDFAVTLIASYGDITRAKEFRQERRCNRSRFPSHRGGVCLGRGRRHFLLDGSHHEAIDDTETLLTAIETPGGTRRG